MSLMNGMKKMCSSVCSFVTYVQALLKHDRLLNTKMQAAIVKKERKEKKLPDLLYTLYQTRTNIFLYIHRDVHKPCENQLKRCKSGVSYS